MSVVPAASFKQRLAAKRKQLEAKTHVEIQVPTYEDLYARYRILGYEDIREMGLRNEEAAVSVAEGERKTAAEVLTLACEELLELTGKDEDGKPIFQSLGFRWTPAAARELFEVDLPDGSDANLVLQYVFPYPHDTLMMSHFNDYMTEADIGIGVVDGAMQGESQASSAQTS